MPSYILIILCMCHLISLADAACQPMQMSFNPSDSSVSNFGSHSFSPFVPLGPRDSYDITKSGLELYLDKPEGPIKTTGNVNDKVAEGATMNSTFTLSYGIVTFVMKVPTVAGSVSAGILIGVNSRDEIDVECLGGDPANFQTNIFAPSPKDSSPHYGEFSSTEKVQGNISDFHAYSIDWNAKRIIWSVDGKPVRTLTKEQSKKNGMFHYPSTYMRLQIGIWDASSPVGTSEWARGPIDWNNAPRRNTVVIKSVEVECRSA